MRLLAAAVGLVALTGCVAGGTLLAKQDVDDSFTEVTLRWAGTFGGTTSTYYIKSFEKDGMIALCGVRVSEEAAVADDLAGTWVEQARVAVGGRQNTIASGRFMNEVPAGTPRDQMTAMCIRTITPATAALLAVTPRLVGGAVEIHY